MKKIIISIGIILLFFFNIPINALNSDIDINENDYILITSENFASYTGANSFQDLVDYHNSHGLNARIVTTEYIESTINGNDLSEKIRNYIKEQRPEYVLLGGDTDTIPVKYLLSGYDDYILTLKPTPSDLYYSCIDTTWFSRPDELIPDCADLSPYNPDVPDFSLIGDGFFKENGEHTNTGKMQWTYEDGKIDKKGYCYIEFDEPVDISNMGWIKFNVKTDLKENSQDFYWQSCDIIFLDDNDGALWVDRFATHLGKYGINSGILEEFKIPVKKNIIWTNFDSTELKKIKIIFKRFYEENNCDELDLELNPGDYVLIDDLYFYDYDPTGLEIDSGDLKPEVCVGRACVDSISDIQNFVSKTLRYLNTDINSDDFLKNVLLVDNDDNSNHGVKALDRIQNNYLEGAGFTCGKYYQNLYKILDAKDILLNQDSTNVFIYTGHGSAEGYIADIMFLDKNDVDIFQNTNPFFEYSGACTVGAFDYNDCYAECVTVKTPNGAFAGIWHTRLAWQNYYQSMNYFFDAICNWGYSIGQAFRYQLQKSCGDYRMLAESGSITHNLLGDPAVKIKVPNQNQAPNIPDIITEGIDGVVGSSYEFEVFTTDPDGESVEYGWDWDGNDEVDEWYGPYDSGETVKISYSWDETGNYQIKVKARDNRGMDSGWSDSIKVTMPKLKPKVIISFESFLTNFPKLYNLYKLIIKL